MGTSNQSSPPAGSPRATSLPPASGEHTFDGDRLRPIQTLLAAGQEQALSAWLCDWLTGKLSGPALYALHGEEAHQFLAQVRQDTAENDRTLFDRAVGIAIDRLLDAEGVRDEPDRSPYAQALVSLARLVQRARIKAARDAIQRAAAQTRLISADHAPHLQELTERAVLSALALVQRPGDFTDHWIELWRTGPRALWPIATAGLRHADPTEALRLLPDIVERAGREPTVPLGEILWAYAFAPSGAIGEDAVKRVIAGLLPHQRQLVAQALGEIGFSEADRARLVAANPGSAQLNAVAAARTTLPPADEEIPAAMATTAVDEPREGEQAWSDTWARLQRVKSKQLGWRTDREALRAYPVRPQDRQALRERVRADDAVLLETQAEVALVLSLNLDRFVEVWESTKGPEIEVRGLQLLRALETGSFPTPSRPLSEAPTNGAI